MGGFLSYTFNINKVDGATGIETPMKQSIVTWLLMLVGQLVNFFLTAGYTLSRQNVHNNKPPLFPWLFSQETKKKIKETDETSRLWIHIGSLIVWVACGFTFFVMILKQNDYFLKTFSRNTVPAITTAVTTAV